MKLTKKQIKAIKLANRKAMKADSALSSAMQEIALLIEEFTDIEGVCDFLAGDGVGFVPDKSDKWITTHIPIDLLIESAENGVDITEEFILNNLSI